MPKFKPLPSYEYLHSVFKVVFIPNDKLGIFSGLAWKIDKGTPIKADRTAGYRRPSNTDPNRYDWSVVLDGNSYIVPRIIYFMVHRINPLDFKIDHIDRNTDNNNSFNLRLDTTNNIQGHNRRKRSDNTSGVIGVSQRRCNNKWRVRLCDKNIFTNLGDFNCKLKAAQCYNTAVIAKGLHALGKPLNDLDVIICNCPECSKKSII